MANRLMTIVEAFPWYKPQAAERADLTGTMIARTVLRMISPFPTREWPSFGVVEISFTPHELKLSVEDFSQGILEPVVAALQKDTVRYLPRMRDFVVIALAQFDGATLRLFRRFDGPAALIVFRFELAVFP
jgi:hypothetical protein